jgi:hypothetical protein
MKLTKAQIREFTALRAELTAKGVPDLITRREALFICNDYALDAPMLKRGNTQTPFRTVTIIRYMVRRGVCPTRTRRFSMTEGRFVS